MDDDENDCNEREVAVQATDEKARNARGAPAGGAQDPENDRGGEEQKRDDAGASRQVPERLRVGRGDDHAAAAGQPGVDETAPSYRTRRAGSASAVSHVVAPSPRTTAAVLAVFAPTHDDAVTVTVRQYASAERPVRGSTM